MKLVSTINQIRRDIIAAYENNPHDLLEAMTDHPQATLNQFTRSYGIQLLAEEELPVITYLTIKLQQGYDLNDLLAESISLRHKPSSVHATLYPAHKQQEIVAAATDDDNRLRNK